MTDTNDLIDLMREYGVEVYMLGTDEESSPTGVALADMLTEIHMLRSRLAAARISAERQPVQAAPEGVSDEELGYRPDARGRRGSDSTLWCASPFGEDDCTAWFQDSRRSSFRGAIMAGWTRDKHHLWLCPDCSRRVFDLRISRAVRAALGPAVPSIPKGWYIINAWSRPISTGDYAEVVIAQWSRGMTHNETKGTGPTWIDALAAAIAQIGKERENEG
jgi:hypothetical protein